MGVTVVLGDRRSGRGGWSGRGRGDRARGSAARSPRERLRAAALSALALAALSGCAQNAILELDVPLPAAFTQDGTRFEHAVVQVRRAPTDFDVAWLDETTEVAALGEAVRTQRVDIVADGSQITEPLAIKVVYCQNAEGCGRLLVRGIGQHLTVEADEDWEGTIGALDLAQ